MKSGLRTLVRPSLILTYIILLLGTVICLFPFYWMASNSFKPNYEAIKLPPNLLPRKWTIENYLYMFKSMDVGRTFFNSGFVAAAQVLLNLLLSSLVAYALAKLRFPGKSTLFNVVIAQIMIPFYLFIIPLFLLMDKYRLIDTYWALIVPGSVSSFSIFLLRQAFLTVPNDYIEAALVDGANHFYILFKICLPMIKPMAFTVALVTFHWSWNSFLWPFLVVVRDSMTTIPVALARFQDLQAIQSFRWGAMMAALTIAAVPILIFFLFAQKRYVEAFTMSGLKG